MYSTLSLTITLTPNVLEVGPGKSFDRIEKALAKASSGDSIFVYPDPNNYPQTALRIQTASITIRGIGTKPVAISGMNLKYSG